MVPLKEGGQLWTQSNILKAISSLQHPFLNSQPVSKLIYLFQGAHKKILDQSCVSFDQHCIGKRQTIQSPFAPKLWRHDFILWHHMMSHHTPKWFYMGISFRQKPGNHIFFIVTLTFDLWPWPSNMSMMLSRSISRPISKSICQTVWPWEWLQTQLDWLIVNTGRWCTT